MDTREIFRKQNIFITLNMSLHMIAASTGFIVINAVDDGSELYPVFALIPYAASLTAVFESTALAIASSIMLIISWSNFKNNNLTKSNVTFKTVMNIVYLITIYVFSLPVCSWFWMLLIGDYVHGDNIALLLLVILVIIDGTIGTVLTAFSIKYNHELKLIVLNRRN